MSDDEFLAKVALLKRLGWLALVGLVVAVPAMMASRSGEPPMWSAAALVLIVPALLYLLLLTIWHWKARYIGTHSNLWGGLLLIETSGWFKLVYLFRHIIPDARGAGRYQRTAASREA